MGKNLEQSTYTYKLNSNDTKKKKKQAFSHSLQGIHSQVEVKISHSLPVQLSRFLYYSNTKKVALTKIIISTVVFSPDLPSTFSQTSCCNICTSEKAVWPHHL